MNGRDGWLGMKEMWIGYNVGHRMGSLLCYSARQTDWPSDGSMWNSFQPVGPWMGHSFTKLGLGCWRSLNAVRMFITNRLRLNKGLKIPKGQSYPIISAIFYKIIQINQKEIGFEERNHIKNRPRLFIENVCFTESNKLSVCAIRIYFTFDIVKIVMDECLSISFHYQYQYMPQRRTLELGTVWFGMWIQELVFRNIWKCNSNISMFEMQDWRPSCDLGSSLQRELHSTNLIRMVTK